MAEIVSTGIERLDEALIEEKGVVLGSSILIEGSSGSGKELLAKQFASAGVGSENVVYFSTDETSDELIDTFDAINSFQNIHIDGIYSHLATADNDDYLNKESFTQSQKLKFVKL